MDTAIKCLSKNELRFSQPTVWPDKWEQRFYTADYSNVTNDPNVTPKFWACCFTKNKISEAAWKVYNYGKQGIASRCVNFKLKKVAIREQILRKDNNIKNVYEGFMDYSLSDYEIKALHGDAGVHSIHYYKVFECGSFDLEKYLSLMMLKRQAFYYEGEFRFMITPKEDEELKKDETKDIHIDWASVIEGVEVGSDCSEVEVSIFECALKKAGIKCEVKKETLFVAPDNTPIIIRDPKIGYKNKKQSAKP